MTTAAPADRRAERRAKLKLLAAVMVPAWGRAVLAIAGPRAQAPATPASLTEGLLAVEHECRYGDKPSTSTPSTPTRLTDLAELELTRMRTAGRALQLIQTAPAGAGARIS